jgi:DNA modification methylase
MPTKTSKAIHTERIENVPIGMLIPYANNARTHSEDQVNQIAASMREFGFTNPVLIDSSNGVIAGHGRLKAAAKLGMTAVPCIRFGHLSKTQIKALVLADNRIALNAGWDEDLLRIELAALQTDGFDLDLIGFDPEELAALLDDEQDREGLADEDDLPEIPEDPISKPGDVWILGDHKVVCGDSTDAQTYDQLLEGEQIDMIFIDPPYNVNYANTEELKAQGKDRAILNDNMGQDQFRDFLLAAFGQAATVCKAGGPIYIAHADSNGHIFRTAMMDSGFLFKQCLVWVKSSMVMGRQDYQWQHEPILYGWKPGAAHKWYGDFDKKTVIDDDIDVKKMSKQELLEVVKALRKAANSTVVREDKPSASGLHPTMKPVNLVQHFVQNSSREGDTVLDVFGGSGSTLIAAEKVRRRARLIELDPKYVDVIVRRWQDYTGLKALHQETRKAFDEM